VRELGLDLDRDAAVLPVGGVEQRTHDVAGVLDVGGRDVEDRGVDALALVGDLAHLVGVGVALGQCGREDRRVGRHPHDVPGVDELLQLAAGDRLAGQVVEPDRDALLAELGEYVGHVVLPGRGRDG
jgi:hypothetical protein